MFIYQILNMHQRIQRQHPLTLENTRAGCIHPFLSHFNIQDNGLPWIRKLLMQNMCCMCRALGKESPTMFNWHPRCQERHRWMKSYHLFKRLFANLQQRCPTALLLGDVSLMPVFAKKSSLDWCKIISSTYEKILKTCQVDFYPTQSPFRGPQGSLFAAWHLWSKELNRILTSSKELSRFVDSS